jgi:hypothetical protein
MHPSGSCKCLHCAEFFVPDARNRARQRYCVKPACRVASKAASQRAWRQKPENAEYFHGCDNVARVQAWRKAHPGYWRRKGPKRSLALQEISNPQPHDSRPPAAQDDAIALQDLFHGQPPIIVGLIAQLTGSALQEDIAAMTRRLHCRGRAMLGLDAPGPLYDDQTPPRLSTPAAGAVAV